MLDVKVNVKWHTNVFAETLKASYRRNLINACTYMVKVIRADISQQGVLKYRQTTGRGKSRRSQTVKIFNFTHSAPGNPPYKQTGKLWKSIDWSVIDNVGFVGTSLDYGKWLEKGTRKMAARPYLKVNLQRYRSQIKAILVRPIRGAPLPSISGGQPSRSGVLGSGAASLGYH